MRHSSMRVAILNKFDLKHGLTSGLNFLSDVTLQCRSGMNFYHYLLCEFRIHGINLA